MDHGKDLNRLKLPHVALHVRVKVPEAITAVQKFFVIMSDSRRSTQALKCPVDLGAEPFGDIGAILGYVEKNFAEVGFRFRISRKPGFTDGWPSFSFACAAG